MLKHLIKYLSSICNPIFVGGCVRDEIMNIECKDIDIEVYGIDPELLLIKLNLNKEKLNIKNINTIGMSFGIIKIKLNDNQELDISFPRRENRIGNGHRGFLCTPDPNMSIKDAAGRRDFTFNSLCCTLEGEILDFFGGLNDLQKRKIKHTSKSFIEDPLRVLRGMQFAGRFGFTVDENTASVCAILAYHYDYLAKERIWGEWYKFLVKSTVPSFGMWFLRDTGWVECYPVLSKLISLQQDKTWHPEGDVWNHTCQSMDAACAICDRENVDNEIRLVIMLASLCHDFGKISTTEFVDGKIRSRGHDQAGEEYTTEFLESIHTPKDIIKKVVPLVTNHMAHLNCNNSNSVRRLSKKIEPATIYELALVMEADHSGRGGIDIGRHEKVQFMLNKAEELKIKNSAPKPILMGHHLISLGYKPGPEFGTILRRAFEAQLNGEFNDLETGVVWLKQKGDINVCPRSVI